MSYSCGELILIKILKTKIFIIWFLISFGSFNYRLFTELFLPFLLLQIETRTLEEVKMLLDYVAHTKTYLSRIMLDNMVVPQANGDIDISMLKEAVDLINGRFETEVISNIDAYVVIVL